jgi:hypothetical protein
MRLAWNIWVSATGDASDKGQLLKQSGDDPLEFKPRQPIARSVAPGFLETNLARHFWRFSCRFSTTSGKL